MRIVAAVDKFRGTADAAAVAAAIGHAAWERDLDCDEVVLSDGGEGMLDVFGGANRTSIVTGPDGRRIEAGWRLDRRTAVIEMARAAGLTLAGGIDHNDPMAATTAGVGELIATAIGAGARRVIIGLGGSATTDGGHGAIEALGGTARLHGVELLIACDVTTPFRDAAAVFGPQKGASPAQVRMLTSRLDALAVDYRDRFGVDVTALPGAGAAGGLAGGLAAIGGRIVPGFDLVADEVDLAGRIDDSIAVITGEGHLDTPSFNGKVVGGVAALAADAGIPVGVVCGVADDDVAERLPTRSLVADHGLDAAMERTLWCIERSAGSLIDELLAR